MASLNVEAVWRQYYQRRRFEPPQSTLPPENRKPEYAGVNFAPRVVKAAGRIVENVYYVDDNGVRPYRDFSKPKSIDAEIAKTQRRHRSRRTKPPETTIFKSSKRQRSRERRQRNLHLRTR